MPLEIFIAVTPMLGMALCALWEVQRKRMSMNTMRLSTKESCMQPSPFKGNLVVTVTAPILWMDVFKDIFHGDHKW
jgi:hypothetical protein